MASEMVPPERGGAEAGSLLARLDLVHSRRGRGVSFEICDHIRQPRSGARGIPAMCTRGMTFICFVRSTARTNS